MQLSLSRIEREYVLSSLSESLSPLELSCSSLQNPLSVQAYRVFLSENRDATSGPLSPKPSRPCIAFRLPEGIALDGMRVVVRFSHRKRRMRFESAASAGDDGLVTLSIPEDIFLDNDGSGASTRLVFELDGIIHEAGALESLPLECPSAGDTSSSGDRLAAISLRASIPAGNTAAASRLLEYLEEYRRKRIPPVAHGGAGHFIFIDNTCILLAMPRSSLEAGTHLALGVMVGSRVMHFCARVDALVPLSSESVILVLSCADAQEEDKRFMYERLYGGLYNGSPVLGR